MRLDQIAASDSVTGEGILDEPDEDYDLTPCPRCSGIGKISVTSKGAPTHPDCPACNGSGNLEGEL